MFLEPVVVQGVLPQVLWLICEILNLEYNLISCLYKQPEGPVTEVLMENANSRHGSSTVVVVVDSGV